MDKQRLQKICEENGLPKPIFGTGRAVIVVDFVPVGPANTDVPQRGPVVGERKTMTKTKFLQWMSRVGFQNESHDSPAWTEAAAWMNSRLGTKYEARDLWKWGDGARSVPHRVVDLIEKSDAAAD